MVLRHRPSFHLPAHSSIVTVLALPPPKAIFALLLIGLLRASSHLAVAAAAAATTTTGPSPHAVLFFVWSSPVAAPRSSLRRRSSPSISACNESHGILSRLILIESSSASSSSSSPPSSLAALASGRGFVAGRGAHFPSLEAAAAAAAAAAEEEGPEKNKEEGDGEGYSENIDSGNGIDRPEFRFERPDRSDSTPGSARVSVGGGATIGDYISLLRPITLLQALGALVVGRLALVERDSVATKTTTKTTLSYLAPVLARGEAGAGGPSSLSAASTSIAFASVLASTFLSYGAGMVLNDCSDAKADSRHADMDKRSRSIASGRVTIRDGTTYAVFLSVASLSLGFFNVSVAYSLWTASNLALMAAYAFRLQRFFLIKNLVVGYLSVSPLIGAALLDCSAYATTAAVARRRLLRLASVGLAISVAREILKDIEDVESDRGIKSTLPLVVGEQAARQVAFVLAWAACASLCLPSYRSIFSSTTVKTTTATIKTTTTRIAAAEVAVAAAAAIGQVPWYGLGCAVGMVMCALATVLPIKGAQKMLKGAIYSLLGGMIAGMLS